MLKVAKECPCDKKERTSLSELGTLSKVVVHNCIQNKCHSSISIDFNNERKIDHFPKTDLKLTTSAPEVCVGCLHENNVSSEDFLVSFMNESSAFNMLSQPVDRNISGKNVIEHDGCTGNSKTSFKYCHGRQKDEDWLRACRSHECEGHGFRDSIPLFDNKTRFKKRTQFYDKKGRSDKRTQILDNNDIYCYKVTMDNINNNNEEEGDDNRSKSSDEEEDTNSSKGSLNSIESIEMVKTGVKSYEESYPRLNRLFWSFALLVIAMAYVHSVLHLAVGCITWLNPGTLLSDTFIFSYNEEKLSLLIPVWNNFGSSLPFNNVFTYISVMSLFMLFIQSILLWMSYMAAFLTIGQQPAFHAIFSCVTAFYGLTHIFIAAMHNIYNILIFQLNRDSLKRLLRGYYGIFENNQFTTAFNMLMILGKCCGVDGPNDFKSPFNISFHVNINPYSNTQFYYITERPEWPNKDFEESLVIPPACCKRLNYTTDIDTDTNNLLTCAKGSDPELFYHKGCLKVYSELFDYVFKTGIISLMLIMGIVLIIFSIISFMRYKTSEEHVQAILKEVEKDLKPDYRPVEIEGVDNPVASPTISEIID